MDQFYIDAIFLCQIISPDISIFSVLGPNWQETSNTLTYIILYSYSKTHSGTQINAFQYTSRYLVIYS